MSNLIIKLNRIIYNITLVIPLLILFLVNTASANTVKGEVVIYNNNNFTDPEIFFEPTGIGVKFCACIDNLSNISFLLEGNDLKITTNQPQSCNSNSNIVVDISYNKQNGKINLAFDSKNHKWVGATKIGNYVISVLLAIPFEKQHCGGTGGGTPPSPPEKPSRPKDPGFPKPVDTCQKLGCEATFCSDEDEDKRLACRKNDCCSDKPTDRKPAPPREAEICEEDHNKIQLTCDGKNYCCVKRVCYDDLDGPCRQPTCRTINQFSCTEMSSGNGSGGGSSGGSSGGGGGSAR